MAIMELSTQPVYLKRSKSERVRPRTSGEEGGHGVVGETVEHISPRPHHRRLSMGHHPRASHHGTPQRLTVEPENGNFGLSTSDVSLDSSSSCNPSYKYGNQVSRKALCSRAARMVRLASGQHNSLTSITVVWSFVVFVLFLSPVLFPTSGQEASQ